MKTVTFKTPGTKIKFQDGTEINEDNLTSEKFDQLIKKNPSYERFFIVKELKEAKVETKKDGEPKTK